MRIIPVVGQRYVWENKMDNFCNIAIVVRVIRVEGFSNINVEILEVLNLWLANAQSGTWVKIGNTHSVCAYGIIAHSECPVDILKEML